MYSGSLNLSTVSRREMVDITSKLARCIHKIGISDGLLTVFNPHTTAGLTINEGADPDVRTDLIGVFEQMVPHDFPYRHREGNSPAHMMATLTGSSVTVLVQGGQLHLGTWQKIFFCEYDGPRQRTVWWSVLTDSPAP